MLAESAHTTRQLLRETLDMIVMRKLVLEIGVHSRRGIGPAAAFLYRLIEKLNINGEEFLDKWVLVTI